MIFQNINLPAQLSDALDRDELVIFVGAGVSCSAPSNLPLFKGLVEQIGSKLGRSTEDSSDELSLVLDRWKGAGDNVHQATKDIIEKSTEPNELHRLLVSLFKKPKKVKLVTTNFDSHLSTVFEREFPDYQYEENYAPALPRGDDFAGIVYLHGSVKKAAKHFVLTSSDLGKAYYTQGWARDFLIDLFKTYSVLFVGYQHADPLLNYVVQGLKGKKGLQPRWALVQEPDDEASIQHLDHLGVNVLTYAKGSDEKANPHHVLPDFFREWNEFRSQSVFDRINALRQTARGGLPADETQEAFIKYCLGHPHLTKELCSLIEDSDWVIWLNEQGYFNTIFSAENPELTECDKELNFWLCATVRQRFPETLLRLIKEHNNTFSKDFAFELCRHVANSTDNSSPYFNIFSNIVLDSSRDLPAFIYILLLGRSSFEHNSHIVFRALEKLSTPSLQLEKPVSFLISGEKPASKNMEYGLFWDRNCHFPIQKFMQNSLQDGMREHAKEIFRLACRNLSLAHSLLESVGASSSWLLSYRRVSISVYEQENSYREDISFLLIDILREVIDYWIENVPGELEQVIKEFATHDFVLFRRFAIYCLGRTPLLSSDEKIKRILEHHNVLSSSSKKEIYDFFDSVYGEATTAIRVQFISRLNELHAGKDEDHEYLEHEKLNLLSWIAKNHSDCKKLKDAIAELKSKYPDFKVRLNPFNSFVSVSRRWGAKTEDLNPQEFTSKPPELYIETILSAKDSFDKAGRSDYLIFLKELFGEDLEWGLLFLNAVSARGIVDGNFWSSIYHALSENIESSTEVDTVLTCLENLQDFQEAHLGVTQFLLGLFFGKRRNSFKSADVDRALQLILRSWDIHKEREVEISSGRDVYTDSINDPSGQIVEFIIHYLSDSRSIDENIANGVPERIRSVFIEMIEGESSACLLARISLIAWSGYLFVWYEDFWRENILPLFDDSFDESLSVWETYILYGRTAFIQMEEILSPCYIKLAKYVQESAEDLGLDSEFDRLLGRKIGGVAIYVFEGSRAKGYLVKALRYLSADSLASVMLEIKDDLKKSKIEEIEEFFDDWFGEYLSERKSGIPIALTPEESLVFSKVCLLMPTKFKECVSLLNGMPLNGKLFVHGLEKKIIGNELLNKFPKEVCLYCCLNYENEEYSYGYDALIKLLPEFENRLCFDDEFLIRFKTILLNRGWSPPAENEKLS